MPLHNTIEIEDIEDNTYKSVICSQTLNNESKSLEILTRVWGTGLSISYRVTVADIYHRTRYDFDALEGAVDMFNTITKAPE